MFIRTDYCGYGKDGEQKVGGRFLIFMLTKQSYDAKGKLPIRCLVRYVRMSQCGHFMMGKIRIKRQSFVVSGSYGSDGLPMDVPQEIYDMGVELPDDLYNAWNNGGGHNGAGNEADAVREWALRTFPKPMKQFPRGLKKW